MAANIGFFGMLHQIYNAVGTIASAVGRGANALDNLGKWAEEQTAAFVDEAQIERQAKIAQLRASKAAQAQALVIDNQPSTATNP